MASFLDAALDRDVALRVLRGDMDAIARAYKVFAKPVMSMAVRILRDTGLAEEVVQDTFMDLMAKAAQIDKPDAIGAWVRRVAVNHCLMRLRSPWHARRSAQDLDSVDEQQYEIGADYQGSEQRLADMESLELALGVLSPESRAVVWLHDVEGYTHQEIGLLMDKTASFSKSQLSRAYSKMLTWYEQSQEVGDSVAPNRGEVDPHDGISRYERADATAKTTVDEQSDKPVAIREHERSALDTIGPACTT